MEFILSVFGENRFFIYPQGETGWLVWSGLLLLILWLLWRFRNDNTPRKNYSWELLIFLIVLIPITGLLFGARLPVGAGLPFPGIPLIPTGAIVLLFSAIAWMLAGVYLGPLAAGIFAGIIGWILGYFGNHSFFMPLIYALLGTVFSLLLRQRFRTGFFRLLRRPLVSSVLLIIFFPILYFVSSLFLVNAEIPVLIEYILSHLGGISLSFAIQVLIGGLLVEIISLKYPSSIFDEEDLEPSPSESSLEVRLFSMVAPLVFVFVLILMAGDWMVASRTSRDYFEDQLRLTVDTAAENISAIQITGQSLLMAASEDERLLLDSEFEDIDLVLQEILRQTPFFDQVSLLDSSRQSIAGFPESNFNLLSPSQSELEGIALAGLGIPFQYYSLAPQSSGMSARVSMIVPVFDPTGEVVRILLGRTSLDSNPYFSSVIELLKETERVGGQGIVIDSQNLVLYHTQTNLSGQMFDGDIQGDENFYYGNNSSGMRILEYYKPIDGHSWTVITSVPDRIIQQEAWEIAAPLLGLLAILLVLGFFLLRYSLRLLSRSLQNLAAGSVRISEGDSDHAMVLEGADEVGQLGYTVEKMRMSLQSRLNDANRLLNISEGVSSGLEIETAVQAILEGALLPGGSSARMILTSNTHSEDQKPPLRQFGHGEKAGDFEALDNQILKLTQKQDEIILTDLSRSEIIHPNGLPLPASLMAVALRFEDELYGTLWIGYEKSHRFSKAEMAYILKVAEQAAMAAANARQYATALLGRQRLEAVLFSTPDPVLVTDHKDRLLIVNPAAKVLIETDSPLVSGISINEMNAPQPLLDLLRSSESTSASLEISFGDGRIYNANASTIISEGQILGRVCVLRDVTYFKEDEALKSEFVSTVSHDLRTPLTLVQGFASMLDMVGDLNDEQTKFVAKITDSVESMTTMVNNMLEIDRLEESAGLKLEKILLSDLAKQAVDEMQILAINKQIKLSAGIPEEEIPAIFADKTLLRQALQNLIENAIHFTETGGTIEVSTGIQNDSAQFVVKDSGVGIAPIDQQRVFERFYRVGGFDASKVKGSGLGLAIVKSIAEKHGGSIRVESQLGVGSTFYLTIPIREN